MSDFGDIFIMTTTVSSYLVFPRFTSRRRRWQHQLRYALSFMTPAQPRVTTANAIITLIALAAAIRLGLAAPATIEPALASSQTASKSEPAPAPAAAAPAPSELRPVRAATKLPGGPTGQLLPAGSMAPYGTYFNTYIKGQCTWYVASRRPVPNNWGNAVSWHYHALGSGWRVGTTPAVAAIAWTAAGAAGHVALVENVSANHAWVYISEMNFNGGAGRINHRWVPAGSFKYIY